MHPVSTADTGRFGRTLVVVAVIPARFHSTRLPGKPLADIHGRPMIEHVYRRAQASGVARTIVATDDERVVAAVRHFGGEAVLTRADHPSGTDRLAEVAASLDCDVVVNVQGDEPAIAPETIASAIQPFRADPALEMSTLARRIDDVEEFRSPNVVKVVTGLDGCALYFSRAPIPFARDAGDRFAPGTALKHIGLYVYRRDVLLRLAALAPTDLERAESLEQLRALEHGVRIRVVETVHDSIGVDTPADLARVRQVLAPVAAS